MGFFKEFKEFALKGSVVDLAVGLVIGTAFGAIVKSLVDDVIMPLMGLVMQRNDLSKQFIVLRGSGPTGNETVSQAREGGAIIITYGNFLNNILTFVLVALALFVVIKQINRLRRQKKNKPVDPTDKNCVYCFQTIPIKATRCPHCTSPLPAPTAAQAAVADAEGKPS